MRLLSILFLLGVAMAPASGEGLEKGEDASHLGVEVVVYTLLPTFTEADVERLLDDGLSWKDIEDQGVVDIDVLEQIGAREGAGDGVQDFGAERDGRNPVESCGSLPPYKYYNVKPGQTVNTSYSPSINGATWIFLSHGTNASNGNAIQDGKARADYYKYKDGAWVWYSKSMSEKGYMNGDLSCGSSCSKVRQKIQNKASSANQNYVVTLEGC